MPHFFSLMVTDDNKDLRLTFISNLGRKNSNYLHGCGPTEYRKYLKKDIFSTLVTKLVTRLMWQL